MNRIILVTAAVGAAIVAFTAGLQREPIKIAPGKRTEGPNPCPPVCGQKVTVPTKADYAMLRQVDTKIAALKSTLPLSRTE